MLTLRGSFGSSRLFVNLSERQRPKDLLCDFASKKQTPPPAFSESPNLFDSCFKIAGRILSPFKRYLPSKQRRLLFEIISVEMSPVTYPMYLRARQQTQRRDYFCITDPSTWSRISNICTFQGIAFHFSRYANISFQYR